MKNIKNHRIKLYFFLAAVLCVIFLSHFTSAVRKTVKREFYVKEKTVFTKEEIHQIWSVLGLDYFDLGIEQAWFNDNLYVMSQPFERSSDIMAYFRQFEGNEKVSQRDTASEISFLTDNGRITYKGCPIDDINYLDGYFDKQCIILCENEKYYLLFERSETRTYENGIDLYEMFGFKEK
jgi:hypothetical protein